MHVSSETVAMLFATFDSSHCKMCRTYDASVLCPNPQSFTCKRAPISVMKHSQKAEICHLKILG